MPDTQDWFTARVAPRFCLLGPLAAILVGSPACRTVSHPDCSNVAEAPTCATQLATTDLPLRSWKQESASKPVVLYIDRSGSMRGFLDPSFTKRSTDYSAVINGLVVGLKAASAFSFGSSLRPAPLSLGALHDHGFYDDADTRLEQALAQIAADSGRSSSHVIVGDGRRGSPQAGNAQYSEMRDRARQWVAGGGTFAVGASLAPFRPVAGDPAGCHNGAGPRETCPLYAFAFIAPGDETRVASILSAVFEHLFVWPLPAVRPGHLMLRAEAGTPGITLHPQWSRARDNSSIARTGGAAFQNVPLPVEIVITDSTPPLGRLEVAALRGQALRVSGGVRALALPPLPWSDIPADGSLVRAVKDVPLRLGILTHGSSSPAYLYRIDLHATGTPSWLPDFDATSAQDALRTFGLRWLFTGFEVDAADAAPVGRVFIVAN